MAAVKIFAAGVVAAWISVVMFRRTVPWLVRILEESCGTAD